MGSHYENTSIQIYGKFQFQKTENFQIKNSIFHISAQNIDCRYSLELLGEAVLTTHNLCFLAYSLEPSRRGSSNEYPQSMF